MSEPGTSDPPEQSWDLSRAIDALAEAARQAGRPGWIWLAGAVYPGWTAFQLLLERTRDPEGGFGFTFTLLAIPLWLVAGRLMAGLARVAHPLDWQRAARRGGAAPGLRDVWRAGRGSTFAALGLWALVSGMLLLVLLLLLAPFGFAYWRLSEPFEPTALVVVAPALAFLAVYAAVLAILHQLALHSLVRNRRGVGSALVHAWRIARHSPRHTFQAFLAEAVLSALIFLFGALIAGLFGWKPTIAVVLGVALNGFGGVTRAAFWARAYRALGGLAPEDGVPGLEEGLRAGPAPGSPAA